MSRKKEIDESFFLELSSTESEIFSTGFDRDFEKLYDSAPIGMLVHVNGLIKVVNKELLRILGFNSHSDLVNKSLFKLIPQSLKTFMVKRMLGVKEGIDHDWVDIFLLNKDGEKVLVEMKESILEISRNTAIQVTINDISWKRKSEESLKLNERRYRLVTEKTGKVVFEHDLNTGVIKWIGDAPGLTGYSTKELNNISRESWLKNVHYGERAKVKKLLEGLKNNEEDYQVKYLFRQKNGDFISIEESGSYFSDPISQSKKIVGSLQDITEQVFAEKAIKSYAYQQAVLAEFGKFAISNDNPTSLFSHALQLCINTLDIDLAFIFKFEPEKKEVVCQDSYAQDAEKNILGLKLPVKAGSPIEKIISGKLPYTEISRDDTLSYEYPFRKLKIKSGLNILISGKHEPYGVLTVYSTQKRKFTTDEIHFLQSISNVISGSIRKYETGREMALLEKRFFTTFNNSPVPAFVATIDHEKIMAVNEKFLDVLGFEREKVTGLCMRDIDPFVVPNEKDFIFKKISEGEKIQNFECSIRKKDGSVIDALISLDTIHFDGEKCILGIFQDISGRKEAERELNKRYEFEKFIGKIWNNFLQPGLEEIDKSIVTGLKITTQFTRFDRAYIVLFENTNLNIKKFEWHRPGKKSLREYLKLKKMKSFSWWMNNIRNNRKIVITDVNELPQTAAKEKISLTEFGTKTVIALPLISEKGVIGYLAVSSEKAREAGPDLVNHMELLANVFSTAIKRLIAEKELAENQERMAFAFEGAGLGFWDWNIETGKIVSNDQWAIMLGYSPGDVRKGKYKWENLVHPDDLSSVWETVKKHLDGELPFYEREYRMLSKQGNYKWILDRGKVVEWDENKKPIRVSGTHLDITLRKMAEERQKNLTEDLIRYNNELQRFAYITSHNLRAPVVNLQSLIELYEIEEEDEFRKEDIIDKIKESVNRLSVTLNDLIEVVALKNNRSERKEFLSLEDLFNQIRKSIEKQINDVNAQIKFDFSKAGKVRYVRSHLHSVLLNLLTNALKYRSPERKLKIGIRSMQKNGKTVIVLKDNGIGIDLQKNSDKIFGLYQRFNSKVEGKGLGLFIVKSQLESLGSKISVKSDVNKGTEFHITLNEE